MPQRSWGGDAGCRTGVAGVRQRRKDSSFDDRDVIAARQPPQDVFRDPLILGKERQGFEGGDEVGRVGEPVRRILRDQARDDRQERVGDIGAHTAEVRRRREVLVLHDGQYRARLERRFAGQHLESDDPQGILIALRTNRGTGALLGAHELRRPHDRATGRHLRILRRAGEAKVGDVDSALLIEQDVRALDVAVNGAAFVRIRQRARDGPQHRDNHGNREGALILDDRVERASLDELHHDVVDAARFPDLEDRHDVGVVERRGAARFAPQPVRDRAAVGGSDTSSALNTAAMPPRPHSRSISYSPPSTTRICASSGSSCCAIKATVAEVESAIAAPQKPQNRKPTGTCAAQRGQRVTCRSR